MTAVVHRAPWVVPVVGPPIADGAVALDGRGVVTAVGALPRAAGEVEHRGVLLPGLVNAHTHLELCHLGGQVAGGDGLAGWIRRLLVCDRTPVADAVARQVAAAAARGTVALADVGSAAPQVDAAFGVAGAPIERVRFFEQIAPRGQLVAGPRGARPAAHATYTCSGAALRELGRRAGGALATIHVEEDPAEAAWLGDRSGPLAQLLGERQALGDEPPPGLRPVGWLDALGVLGAGTLLVHLTFADAAALQLAARRGACAVLCPRSNLHITGTLPPFFAVAAAGLAAALGTDSMASSPSLDLLAEVQVLARAGCDPRWALKAATLGGARALGLAHLGALTVGRRPGLVELGDCARALRDPVAWIAREGADAPARRLDGIGIGEPGWRPPLPAASPPAISTSAPAISTSAPPPLLPPSPSAVAAAVAAAVAGRSA